MRFKITSGKLRNISCQLVRDKQATNTRYAYVLNVKDLAIRHIMCLKLSAETYTVYLANYMARMKGPSNVTL